MTFRGKIVSYLVETFFSVSVDSTYIEPPGSKSQILGKA